MAFISGILDQTEDLSAVVYLWGREEHCLSGIYQEKSYLPLVWLAQDLSKHPSRKLKFITISKNLFDITGDENPEIVVAFTNGEIGMGFMSLENAQDPLASPATWTNLVEFSDPKTDIIQLMDVDRDGDLDVVTTEEVSIQGIFWLENPKIP